MVKTIRRLGVLVCVCAILALSMVGCGNDTDRDSDRDSDRNSSKKPSRNTLQFEVMPDGRDFEKVDLDDYVLPDSITKAYAECDGLGYVLRLTVKGFNDDMVIECGVTADGVVTGATCLSSNETNGKEKTYGEQFIGKDAAGVEAVDTIAGSTLTTAAYKNAIKDAINTVSILKGEVVDLRTPEEKALDQMKADLEATEEVDLSQFILPASVTKALKGTKGSIVYLTVSGYGPGMEIVCGVGADNKIVNAICLSSNESYGKEKTYGEQFIGKDAAGVDAVDTIGGVTMTTAAYKNAIKDAINAAIVLDGGVIDINPPAEDKPVETVPMVETIDLTAYKGIHEAVTAAGKDADGNYVIHVNGYGFAYFGDPDHYIANRNIPIQICAVISPDGVMLKCLTINQQESGGYGDACGEERYYSQFDGKTADTYKEVDGIAGATITSNGYMKAIGRCFDTIAILEGGKS